MDGQYYQYVANPTESLMVCRASSIFIEAACIMGYHDTNHDTIDALKTMDAQCVGNENGG